MIAQINSWLNLEQYGNPVRRRIARNGAYYALLAIILVIMLLFNAIVFGPASDLPTDLALVTLFIVGSVLMTQSIRSGDIDRAAWVMSAVILLGPVIAFGYEGYGFRGLNTYWIGIILLALLGNRRLVFWTGVAILAVWVGTALSPEADNPSIVSLVAILAIQLFANMAALLVANDLASVAEASIESEATRRLRLIEISNQVVTAIFSRADIDVLLRDAVEDIRVRFDEVYHAQVFLIDDDGHDAVLRSSTGPVGRQLLERNHKLGVGTQSVIGQVTQRGSYVMASDTSTDSVHKRNELLPETRTELALPLRVEGGSVIGALDLQSRRPNAFQSEDVEIFQILADQLALAIDNARLLADTRAHSSENERLLRLEQSSRREIERLNRELTAQAWQTFTGPKAVNQRLNLASGQFADIKEPSNEVKSAIADGSMSVVERNQHQHIMLPIKSNNVVIGALEFELPTNKQPDSSTLVALEAVGERVGLFAENARLFEQTQTALTEVERLYEMSQVVNAAADSEIHDIYEIIVQRLVVDDALDRVAILIADPVPSFRTSNLIVDYRWDRSPLVDGDWQEGWHLGQRLDYLRRGFPLIFEQNPSQQVRVDNTINARTPSEQVLADMLAALDATMALLVPLVSGGRWFGLLVCASNSRGGLSQRFANFAQAAAGQLAASIDNRRLLREVQDEARRALALAEAGQTVSVLSGTLQDGVTRLFRSVSGPGEFDRWWFGTVSEGGSALHVISSGCGDNLSLEFPENFDVETVDNALTEVVLVPQAILVDNYDEAHPILGELSPATAALYGKHLAVPVTDRNDEVRGVLMIGRSLDGRDLDERDMQLASTLANQLSIAVENQQLFTEVESQRQILNNTIATMPAGVIIYSPTGEVTLANQQAIELLGPGVHSGIFADNTYPIFDVNTNLPHDQASFPTTVAIEQRQRTSGHNFYVLHPTRDRLDVLMSTALVYDTDQTVSTIVAIFQEITDLRQLETALQSSLSETTALYEASRAIAASATKTELINALLSQLRTLTPDEIYLYFREGQDETELQTNLVAIHPAKEDLALPTGNINAFSIPEALLTRNEVILVDNVKQNMPDGVETALVDKLTAADIQAIAIHPLLVRGTQVIGWFVICYRNHHQFEPDERRFLATLADQAAVSLNVNRLFESTQSALRSVANLYRGNQRIVEASSISEAVQVVREEVMNFSPDRVDLILQQSAEDPEDVYAAIAWTEDRSLADIPALPMDPVTLRAQTSFDILNDQGYYVEDIHQESDDPLQQSLRALDTPYHSVISVPIRVSGRTLGRLSLGFLHRRRFYSDEVQFIGMLADSLAYIVENELLFQQTQDSLEETGVLYQASRAIAASEGRDEVVQAMIDYAASAVVDKVMLITLVSKTWEDPNAQIEVTTTWGRGDFLDLRGLRFTPVQLPIWSQLSANEIVWSDDVENDPNLDEFTRLGFRALDVASYVIVPLQTPTGPLGAIMLGASQPRVHQEREVRIYQSLADQAAVQLENKTLLEQAAIRTRQLEISAQVSQSATQILNLDELFPRIVQLVKDSFGYDHVQIFMIDEQRENAVLRAATGEAGRQMLDIRHSLPVGSQSVVGQATGTGKPFLVSDTSETGVMHRPNPYLPETRAEIAIPLRVKGTIEGAIDVQSNRAGAFGEDDVSALTSLADQLAIAIDNAELFQISTQRANDMSFLFDVTSRSAAATAGLVETLETLGTVLSRQMRAQGVELFLYDEEAQVLASQIAIVADESETGTEYNFIETSDPVALGHGIIGWVGRHLRPIIINDFEIEEQYFPSIASSRSGVFVPLASGQDLIGVLGIEGAQPYQYDEEDLRLLITLSSTITPIIQNATLVNELQTTNERLREIDQLKTNFLAAMSHELRTPLNSIIGFSRVILKGIDGPITDMQQQDIQTIHDSGKHLLGLVNDILDQAKIEAGRMELVREYFDLAAVVKSLMSSAQGLTKDKPIQLFTEIASDLPHAFGDEFRTRQIILNLLGNAAKFTHEGSITVSVFQKHDAEIDRDMLLVSVNDTGIGIAESDQHTIFESFQQIDNSTTRSAEGTGLGLPLARSLAVLQGGRIDLESQIDVGSTFTVLIPIEPLESEVDEEPTIEIPSDDKKLATVQLNRDEMMANAPTRSATAELRRKVILAVDDEIGMINLYRRYLSKEGWQIIGETDPQRTEEMIAAHAPQLILLDINMPNRDGWNVLENLREQEENSSIPIIVCSIETDTERSTKLGAQKHVTKPFDENTLVEAVRAVQQNGNSKA